jgi:tripartite-type tricarboxylate transporter receptor subunit TctC
MNRPHHPNRRTSLAWLAAAGTTMPGLALAQTGARYPTRPVRFVVGFSPGGAVDEIARLVADRLGQRLGQSVIVENRPGAASMLAGEFVANSPPDGHTLLVTGTSILIAPRLQKRASVNLGRFTPVAGLATTPLVIAATPSFPASTPQEFVNEVRKNPGKYFYATSGVGSLHHLGMEVLKRQLNLQVDHVPYKGAGQILPDLMSGQIALGLVSANAAQVQEEAGKLKVIGLLSAGQWSGNPRWKSMSSVAPEFDVMPRMFVLGPAGLPADITRRLDTEIAQALQSADMEQAFASHGAIAQHAGSAALKRALENDDALWSDVVQRLGLQSNG